MITLKNQYKNQVDRIRRAMKKASERGYVFDRSLSDIIKKPKKITSGTIRRLKKITAPKLREKYSVEKIDILEHVYYASEIIIENFVNHIGQWALNRPLGKDYSMRDYALQYLATAIQRFGKLAVARGLQEAADSGLWLSTVEVYEMGVASAMHMIGRFIKAPKGDIDKLTNYQFIIVVFLFF